MPRRWIKPVYLLVCLCGVLAAIAGVYSYVRAEQRDHPVGQVLDNLDGVPVYANGRSYAVSHGRHYAADGYYFGQKWQCVEFIKRYLYQAKKHRLPNVWGHAKHFYDAKVAHGDINPARGMLQYRQGKGEPPKVGDLLVLDLTSYGHVAIISKVLPDAVEVVQQNTAKSRELLPMKYQQGGYYIGTRFTPARGWLRVPD